MKVNPLKTISKALLADRTFDIEFRGYLSNHAKHAVIAHDRLGAPNDRIQEYWDDYTAMTPYSIQLHKVDQKWNEVQPATEDQWCTWRGKKTHWQEQVAFMNDELKKLDNDTDKLIQKYAPELLSGLAGSLTHGIIHLGWAIDAQSPWMITEGLAYLNFCHIGVDEARLNADRHRENSPMESLIRAAHTWKAENLKEDWIDRVKAKYDESFHPELVGSGFQHELSKVVSDPHPVATHLPTWINEKNVDDLWESMYKAATWIYLTTIDEKGHGNFLVLHLLTSLWGLEHVCRVVDGGPTMMKVTRRALSQFYASMICLLSTSGGGFPSVEALEKIQTKYSPLILDAKSFDWDPIVKDAIAEREEHNPKLVYVMRELWKRYGRWSGFSEAAKAFTLTPNIGPDTPEFDDPRTQ